MKARLKKIKEKVAEEKIDGLLVSKLSNIRYLTNFSGSYALLYVGEPSFFITDFRYKEQVKEEVKGPKIYISKKGLLDKFLNLKEIEEVKRIGFETEHLSYTEFLNLKKGLPKAKLYPKKGLIEEAREVKEEEEIELIKKTCAITTKVFEEVIKMIKPGITELELAAEIDYRLRRYGAEKTAFDTIVISGKKSAMPHGKPGLKKIKNREFIILDFGAVFKGYASDFTRTVFLGKATKKQRMIYSIVKKAQENALNNLKPGMSTKSVDNLARAIIKKEGYGKYFGHGLGHGVGLEIHEAPKLSFFSNGILKENCVVTLEPGIYIPGFGGIRTEDTVVIRKYGAEILTNYTKELIEL